MIELIHVYPIERHMRALYDLLAERTPEQSISHHAMPTYNDHVLFVRSGPYRQWYLIMALEYVGSIYLSHRSEIGVSVFRRHQRKGYARAAVLQLMAKHPGPYYANVNPENAASIALWESLAFRHLQSTYARG